MGKIVSVKDLVAEFKFTCIAGKNGLKREIQVNDVNRPGLELAGYFEHSDLRRIAILGQKEMQYIYSRSEDELLKSYQFLTSDQMPAIIITRGYTCPKALLDIANNQNVPVLLSEFSTTKVIVQLTLYLNEKMAPNISIHGTLLEISGSGVLLLGQSGIGKSEIALELISKGHRLIADDRVNIVNIGNSLIGESPLVSKKNMEVRGLGIIDVTTIFGISAFKDKQEISYVINLVPLDESRSSIERIGSEEEYKNILGVDLISISLPVSSGRNIANMVEIAVRNQLLKANGYNASKEFSDRVARFLEKKEEV